MQGGSSPPSCADVDCHPIADAGSDQVGSTSFWNVNIPSEQHTRSCPPYLAVGLTYDRDRRTLSTRDADYQRRSWEEVRGIVRDGRLDAFQRVPSELRRYLEWSWGIERAHEGGIRGFVLRERLGWTVDDIGLEPTPGDDWFTADRYKILFNDWPYGIDRRIVHLVVWTKFVLPAEESSAERPNGDLTAEARAQVEAFVDTTFRRPCGEERVLWFWNWKAIKSIHTVEHFHVLLLEPDAAFVKEVTQGDVAMIEVARVRV